MEKELLKRQKIICLADRSVAGWDSVQEYLPNDLFEDGDDDRWRKAEGRAISSLKRKHQQDPSNNVVPNKKFMSPQYNHAVQNYQSRPQLPIQHVVPQQQQVFIPLHQRPFLWQGASGEGTSTNHLQPFSQPRRYPVPLNACFVCGETGHWKHQCPKR
uniref:CCHC-type domain-containing protein n=1 Tax=Clytia hemisphaerica TaxID=252671 RepID=A0A7M5TTX5_9CNID